MARYTGPKWRLSRREGIDLFYRAGSKFQKDGRTSQPPGVHGPKQYKGKPTGYNLQLREKQKAKRMYSVMEKQFQQYYLRAVKTKGNTAEAMMQFLERRLDNVIYRLGFASTRAQARQLVSHGNVMVNGKKLDIPSFTVSVGETISLSDRCSKFDFILKNIEEKYDCPAWLTKSEFSGKVERLPMPDETDQNIDYQLIVEFYSR